MKRNFSVIKGSALLVGARRVAKVAEAVEGLLVRVTAQQTPAADPVSAAASVVEQIAEIARCRAELDMTHRQMVSGLDALDLGLARLRDLVDRLASDPQPSGRSLGERLDNPGETVGQPEFCDRVGEILDDLESVRRGLIADRQASDEPRARQANSSRPSWTRCSSGIWNYRIDGRALSSSETTAGPQHGRVFGAH